MIENKGEFSLHNLLIWDAVLYRSLFAVYSLIGKTRQRRAGGRIEVGMPERKFTPESKARQAQAGRENLLSWHQRATEARTQANVELDEFSAQLMKELGPSPSATRRAIAASIISNYGSILLLNKELRKQRKVNITSLAERSSWLTSSMLRSLKVLGLDERPRPRTLGDVLAAQVPKTEQIDSPKPPESA